MSTPTLPGIPRQVYLAAALILLNVVTTMIGPISLANPASALAGAVLYGLVGVLFLLYQYAPTQLSKATFGSTITGIGLFGVGLYLIGQASTALATGNYAIAGAGFIAGAILLIVGLVTPWGFLKKALEASAASK